jgi:ferredoxin
MKIDVDLELCISAGICAYTAPAVFAQRSSDGQVVLLSAHPGAELEEPARQAVELCPSGALSFSESDGEACDSSLV